MNDYISREDALLCATGEYADDSFEDSIKEVECKKIAKRLKELKPADVRENTHGEWINAKVGRFFPSNDFKCSICGNILNFDELNCGRGDANFCPNCGADMRKEK